MPKPRNHRARRRSGTAGSDHRLLAFSSDHETIDASSMARLLSAIAREASAVDAGRRVPLLAGVDKLADARPAADHVGKSEASDA